MIMTTEVAIQTERIDDIPLLIQQQQVMGIGTIINRIIRPNGNRQGLSVGWTIVSWISFILSESDHRMSYVEPWAERHVQTLQALLPEAVSAKDFNDDRLGDVLRYLSEDAEWAAIEEEVGRQLVSVYALPTERVRLDSTSASLYHATEGATLFAYGHSKDHRPDLPQVKVMLGALDPLGLPLATLVTPGNQADDPLYWPAIQQSRGVLPAAGVLYIGDSKMEALPLRGRVVGQGDHYLTALSQKGQQPALLEELLQPVWEKTQPLVQVTASDEVDAKVIAKGYETLRWQETQVEGEVVRWQERVLVIYSPTWAEQASRGLMQRVQQAEEKLRALTPAPGRGKRQARDLETLQQAAETILAAHRVHGLLHLAYQSHHSQRVRRAYGDRPARAEQSVRYHLEVTRDEAAIEKATRLFGWRLYVTSAPPSQLALAEAVLAYRSASTIERNFSRLKGRPLGLRPFFVQREDHLKGLIRLLSLALRILTLMEFVVRRSLHAIQTQLTGLFPGNPKQSTDQPTTERLLAAFKEITLTLVHLPTQPIRHVTPLTPLQTRILELLGFSPTLYINLTIANDLIPP
jgi:transposase